MQYNNYVDWFESRMIRLFYATDGAKILTQHWSTTRVCAKVDRIDIGEGPDLVAIGE